MFFLNVKQSCYIILLGEINITLLTVDDNNKRIIQWKIEVDNLMEISRKEIDNGLILPNSVRDKFVEIC